MAFSISALMSLVAVIGMLFIKEERHVAPDLQKKAVLYAPGRGG